MESVQTFAQVAFSRLQEAIIVLNVTIDVKLALILPINVHLAYQVLLQMEIVLQHALLILLILTEIVLHVLKDAMVVLVLQIFVQLVNLDISNLETDVLLHALLINIEMEIMDVNHVIHHVKLAQPLMSVLHVLNQEANQSMEFVIHVFIHVLLVLLMNLVQPV